MLPDAKSESGAAQEQNEISISELFHENSKQQRYNLAFSRRISFVNSSPTIHQVISKTCKTYPGAIAIPLPTVQPGNGLSFEDVVTKRRSIRRFSNVPLDLTEISKLLYFGNGITGKLAPSGQGIVQPVRAAPSGGALYPIELYLAVCNGTDIEPGIYHYVAATHALEQLALGDFAPALSEATSDSALFSHASITIILTAMFERTRFKYGERGYRFALLEAGHIAQNILLTSTALDLGGVAVGGFIDDEINEILGIDGVDEASIYMIALGHPMPMLEEQNLMSVQPVINELLEWLWTGEI
jgi:SagB-type dehydrogenase family enzyme